MKGHHFFVCIFVCSFFAAAHGGIKGLFCPPDGNKQDDSCEQNCQDRHNALYGFCGTEDGDFNCYCSPPKTNLNKDSIQCANIDDHRYDNLCRVDCQCAHNALGGCCNYITKSCECSGQNPNPTSTEFCQYKTLKELAEFVNGLNITGIDLSY